MNIHGFDSDELYAVGLQGALWRYDGSRWEEIASPTNRMLTTVRCLPDGTVWVAGEKGGLLRGRGDEWELVDIDVPKLDILDVNYYQDILYLASEGRIYALAGDQLAPVDFGEDKPDTCGILKVEAGCLWSCGTEDILRFDGNKWERIL